MGLCVILLVWINSEVTQKGLKWVPRACPMDRSGSGERWPQRRLVETAVPPTRCLRVGVFPGRASHRLPGCPPCSLVVLPQPHRPLAPGPVLHGLGTGVTPRPSKP